MNESIGLAHGVSGSTANNYYSTVSYTPTTTSGVKLFLTAFVDANNDEVVHYKNVFYISSKTEEKARDLAVRKMSEEQFDLYQDGLLKIIIKEV